jgi:hypothetical protein
VEALELLIQSIANHGNIAVLVLVLVNTWLIWVIKHGLTLWREQTREQAQSMMRLAEALTELRVTIAADRKGR